jgi:hypothetical protein
MNFDRFEQLANTYGTDIGRWPPALQAPARHWAATDARARDVLAGAAQLDALLRDAVVPVAESESTRLVDQVLARIPAPVPPATARRRAAWRLWPALLFAGAVVAGCATGYERPQWIGLIDTAPAASALASAFDVDGSTF